MDTLSLSFDTRGYESLQDDAKVRVWTTPQGDAVGVYHFALPPDITADVSNVDDVRAMYRSDAARNGFGLVEAELTSVDGCAAIRVIFKAPQEPHGMVYLGSITIPFRDFSCVVKVQCNE